MINLSKLIQRKAELELAVAPLTANAKNGSIYAFGCNTCDGTCSGSCDGKCQGGCTGSGCYFSS